MRRFCRDGFQRGQHGAVGVGVEHPDRLGVSAGGAHQREAILLGPGHGVFVRSHGAGGPGLEPDGGQQAETAGADWAIHRGDGKRLAMHVKGRLRIAPQGPVSQPGAEAGGGLGVPRLSFTAAQDDAYKVVRVAGVIGLLLRW